MDAPIGVGRNIEFAQQHLIDSVIEMWKTHDYARPSEVKVTWPNGDTAHLTSGTDGLAVSAKPSGA